MLLIIDIVPNYLYGASNLSSESGVFSICINGSKWKEAESDIVGCCWRSLMLFIVLRKNSQHFVGKMCASVLDSNEFSTDRPIN